MEQLTVLEFFCALCRPSPRKLWHYFSRLFACTKVMLRVKVFDSNAKTWRRQHSSFCSSLQFLLHKRNLPISLSVKAIHLLPAPAPAFPLCISCFSMLLLLLLLFHLLHLFPVSIHCSHVLVRKQFFFPLSPSLADPFSVTMGKGLCKDYSAEHVAGQEIGY